MQMTLTDRINRATRHVPVWAVYIVYLSAVPWLLYLAQTGGLGREPIKALEHELGEIALQLLIIGLCISPLRRYIGVNLLRFRRAIGLLAFIYVSLHLLVWLVLDVGILSQIWVDIVKRPYITFRSDAALGADFEQLGRAPLGAGMAKAAQAGLRNRRIGGGALHHGQKGVGA